MSTIAVIFDSCVLYPNNTLNKYDIEAQHPDDFIISLLDTAPDIVCATIRSHRLCLKNPPKSVDEYLKTLVEQSLIKTVRELERVRELI